MSARVQADCAMISPNDWPSWCGEITVTRETRYGHPGYRLDITDAVSVLRGLEWAEEKYSEASAAALEELRARCSVPDGRVRDCMRAGALMDWRTVPFLPPR